MNKLSPESGEGSEAVSAAKASTGAIVAVAQALPAAVSQTETEPHAEPKAGGSYTRDPVTGALTRVAGPVPNEQPEGN